MSISAKSPSLEGPRRVLELGETVTERVDLAVDGFVGDRRARDSTVERVVALDRDLRPDLDDGVELDIALFLARGDVDLGRRDHVDVLGLDRLDVVLGQRVAERLVARRLGAHSRLEQPAGGLAGPESRELHLLGELAERGVDGALEIGRGDRDVQLDLVAFERLDRRRDSHGARHSIRRPPELSDPSLLALAARRDTGLAAARTLASNSLTLVRRRSGRDGAAGGHRPLVAGEAGNRLRGDGAGLRVRLALRAVLVVGDQAHREHRDAHTT